MKYYDTTPEIVLGDLPEIEVPEIQVSYTRTPGKAFLGRITTAGDVASFLKRTFGQGELELQEQFIVLYLNQSNNIIGYYRHSKGSITATVADIRLILGTALKCASVAMVVSHNLPSSSTSPSRAD